MKHHKQLAFMCKTFLETQFTEQLEVYKKMAISWAAERILVCQE
jgi:hypothetical protein